MAYTTHEKIRLEAGFQQRFVKEDFLNNPNGVLTTFFVKTDDNIKFVPEFGTGSTIAGVSDVKVWIGLSGIFGVSQMIVNSINIDSGSVTLNAIPNNGCSLTITYSSSSVSDNDIEQIRLQSESILSQRLAQCYELPLTATPSMITREATGLAAALLLIRGYGTGSRSTSTDGYALYSQLMGDNEDKAGKIGEIGMICQPGYQLINDDGTVVPRTDEQTFIDNTYIMGGRINRGRLFDISEEVVRFKPFQDDVNRNQPGTIGTV